MQKRSWTSAIALIFILIGFVVSIYLMVQHYDLIFGRSETKSFCSINYKVDCDAVNTSRFSEIFGIPIAVISIMVLAVMLLLLLAIKAFEESEKQRLARYFLYLCTLNFLGVAYLIFASSFILKTWCLMCSSYWLVAAVLFACAWKLVDGPKFNRLKEDILALFKSANENGARGVLILFLVIPIGSLLVNGMWRQNLTEDFDRLIQTSIADWLSAKKYDFFVEKSPQTGNPSAKVQIVEFSDFLCPHCKRAAPSLHAFVNAHRDDVRFVFQNYPLDSACNKSVKNQVHDNACLFAKWALCANKQEKFAEVHDWLFQHQEDLSPSSLDALVKDIGLNRGSFDSCVNSPEVASELTAEIERGTLAGVQGTPSVFVDGRLLSGGFLIPVLDAALKNIH